MLQNAHFLAKIGAGTAENERNVAKNLQLPYGSSAVGREAEVVVEQLRRWPAAALAPAPRSRRAPSTESASSFLSFSPVSAYAQVELARQTYAESERSTDTGRMSSF